jgi:6-phosphogluconolactonase
VREASKFANGELTILDDARGVAHHAAAWLVDTIAQAGDRRIAICLSGGTTPRALYALLAQPLYATALPWPRIHWFWGDERFVPPSDERNNASMVRQLLLNGAPIPCVNVHPIPTQTASPLIAAREYERELKDYYGNEHFVSERPLFDVTFLGVGDDGHTASLFPGSPLLDERSIWVAAIAEHKPEPRITLTLPALASSRNVVFLVAGAAKRAILAKIADHRCDLPAARVRAAGKLNWFVDRAAAPAPTQ